MASLGGICIFRNVLTASAGVWFGWVQTLHCKSHFKIVKTLLFCFWFAVLLLKSPHLINSLAGYRILGCKSPSKTVEKSSVIPYPDPSYMSCFSFHFFLSGSFQYSLRPGFLKFHNNMLWCGYFHHLLYWAWGGFRQGDPWFQFWELYFCIISLNIASFVFCPFFFFFFSLFGTLTIWILTILDGSYNFLLFPIFSLFTLLLCFLTVHLMFQILCYLKLFGGLLIFIFKRSV